MWIVSTCINFQGFKPYLITRCSWKQAIVFLSLQGNSKPSLLSDDLKINYYYLLVNYHNDFFNDFPWGRILSTVHSQQQWQHFSWRLALWIFLNYEGMVSCFVKHRKSYGWSDASPGKMRDAEWCYIGSYSVLLQFWLYVILILILQCLFSIWDLSFTMCVFRWVHQVRSYGTRNLAVNIWWAHFIHFNHTDCEQSSHKDKELIPLNLFDFHPNEGIRY